MLAFQPRDSARFLYRADFSGEPYANISFYDVEREQILFHLSLRADEGLAVCNRRDARPDGWAREIRRKVGLGREGVQVEIRFAPPEVSVALDGHEVFAFGKSVLRSRRFPNLERIGYVDFQGGISAAGMDIVAAHQTVPETLVLTDRLEVRGWVVLPEGATAPRVRISGLDTAPEVIARPRPHVVSRGGARMREVDLRLVLPGRAWAGVAPDAPIEVQLETCAGPVPALQLTRAACADRIEAILRQSDLHADAFAAMQVIEHVRFAGLLPNLSPAARAALGEAAVFYRLEAFLFADAADGGAPPPHAVPTPRDPDLDAASEALTRITTRLRADPEADAVALLRETELPDGAWPQLVLSLSESFCAAGRMRSLFALTPSHALESLTPVGDDRRDSAMLPFLFLQGRIAELRAVLWRLVPPGPGWVVTPTFAWVVEEALRAPEIEERDREDILHAYMDFVRKRAGDYWARTPCSSLIRTAVALLEHRERLAGSLSEMLPEFALQSYGLSREFWDRVAEREQAGHLVLPPELVARRDAFADLTARAEGQGTPVHEALRLFERAGNPQAEWVRRELMGPAGLDTGGAPPDPDMLRQEGLCAGEGALRYMSFPGSAEASPALAATAARALPERYETVPRAPHYVLQKDTARRAQALLARVAAGGFPPDDAELGSLAADLALLGGRGSLFLGLGVALSMAAGFARAGAAEAAGRMADCAATIRETLPPDDLRQLPWSAAVLTGLHALREASLATRNTGVDRALGLFPCAVGRLPDRRDAPLSAHWEGASPLYDTLVCVFSCLPNLDTRVAAMRAGWLARLRRMGVPHVVVVGDGDGRIEGDVVHLDAPDDYEGLPQKTLATIRWVRDNTSFGHLLKIDDDCFLDPAEFFESLSYRKYDYYGRILTRRPGQLDRAWHCLKARSERGRTELDKSPEPSTYCDGGSGYALSRAAMDAALEAAESPEGRHLLQVSFMEDKLLGDLLALRGIKPAEEDYRISILRRTHPGAVPVSLWVNGFHASRAAPVKLVHLDTHQGQAEALDRLDRDELKPKKVWPSFSPVRLGYQSNALEHVGPLDRLDAAREAEVAVVACMRNEMFMLPHFLEHYRRLGVGAFLIADNLSDDGTLEYLLEQEDVALFSVDTDYRKSHYGVAWQQALLSNFRYGRWTVVADADEFLVWRPDARGSLPDLLRGEAFAGADAVRVFMLDLYPEGRLEDADFRSGDPFAEAGWCEREPFLTGWPGRGPFSNMGTWTSALRHRLIPGSRPDLFVAQKIALLRYNSWMRLSAGLHFLADVRLAQRELLFAHFKYTADFRRKAQAEVARRQHFNDAEEYRKYLSLVSEGRSVIHDPAVSVRWTACGFVRERFQ